MGLLQEMAPMGSLQAEPSSQPRSSLHILAPFLWASSPVSQPGREEAGYRVRWPPLTLPDLIVFVLASYCGGAGEDS